MVASWLPDPPLGRSHNEVSRVSVPAIFVDSDTDDQETNTNDENLLENGGYRLLNDHDNHLDDDHDDAEYEPSNYVSSHPVNMISEDTIPDNTRNSSASSIVESGHTANAEARDINVDYDQVRAVMAHITLPDSATPSWASTIPDSEWCTLLQNRIRTLQERSEMHPESRN